MHLWATTKKIKLTGTENTKHWFTISRTDDADACDHRGSGGSASHCCRLNDTARCFNAKLQSGK